MSESNSDDDPEFKDCHQCQTDKWILGDIISDTEQRIDSKNSARIVVNNLENWTHNRTLDSARVDALAAKISGANRILGTISLAMDSTERVRILDGQHRVEAVKKLISTDPHIDFVVHMATYRVSRLDSQETLDLFYDLNDSKSLAENPVHKTIHSIITTLQRTFPNAIFESDKRKQRPNIDTRRLKERLEVNLLNHFATEMDPEPFIEIIGKLNSEYGTKRIQELFGNQKKQSRNRFQKAQRTGWYLTMFDMAPLPNDAHKDSGGNLLFCDAWIHEVIRRYKGTLGSSKV